MIDTGLSQEKFSRRNTLAYGLLGLPLAFVALPLYVILPNHYAREFGVPLATLGAILLLARLFDALIDPLLGRLSDRLFARSARAVLIMGGLAALLLALGFALLFFPLVSAPDALLAWAGATLMLTYAGYSALSVAHQSWGARLGGNEAERSRLVAWREGLGLVGVVVASVTPVALGLPATTAIFFVALAAGWLAWTRSVPPPTKIEAALNAETKKTKVADTTNPVKPANTVDTDIWLPFRSAAFRSLLTVFMLNGIASAVPATLVLFFIQDLLQAPAALEPLFLGSYFLSAALSMPLWLALVKRLGLARTWLCGMLLAIAVFAWASQMGAGQTTAFVVICALSGIALGTDLALPGALLTGVIQANGDSGRAEGAYFGWWSFATKLNLALAAGLALPLLALFGYAPGVNTPTALNALLIAYCVLPCLLKLAAAGSLYFLVLKKPKLKPYLL
ncbi:putative symporter YjmB [Polaromonas vacuolata]|uniref:Putative symporter YjmB n=1 Tax=Polaromonas vacuolata TaxID=37448 RepID=A0A6H2HE28_9BURK|nr:MFS transporter [Polaromonas vacuolata]QJC58132.1 putative symporter YjmB [Polaromonas vacuolata]